MDMVIRMDMVMVTRMAMAMVTRMVMDMVTRIMDMDIHTTINNFSPRMNNFIGYKIN